MPLLILPTTREGYLSRHPEVVNKQSQARWGVDRIVQPLVTGVTLYKLNGEWHDGQYVSQTILDASEYYYLGGHEYEVPLEIILEIIAAGYDVDYEILYALYPGATTFPGPTTYPGLAI